MDEIPALNLWDLVIQVFHPSPIKTNKTKDDRGPRGNLSAKTQPNMRKQIPTKHTNFDPTNIDHVPPNGTHSGSNAMLYVFEDNEAVIKMLIKGRSPTMRHVPTHTAHHTEAVFSKVMEIHGRRAGDPMDDLDVNMAILVNICEYHSSSSSSSRTKL